MNTGMIFAMIFTVIIIGFILAVGFGQIQDFFCLGSNAQANNAILGIESIVEEVFVMAAGSGKTYPLSLPADVKVCFVNTNDPSPVPYTDRTLTWNPDLLILEEMLENPKSPSYKSNLWIYLCGSPLGEGYKMSYLSPSKSFCAKKGTQLYIENKGAFVDISPV